MDLNVIPQALDSPPLELSVLKALESQAIDFGPDAIAAYWSAFAKDAEEIAPAPEPVTVWVSTNWMSPKTTKAVFLSGDFVWGAPAIPPAPSPDTTTAPSCSGLTTTAHDGERLGRLNWTPGA